MSVGRRTHASSASGHMTLRDLRKGDEGHDLPAKGPTIDLGSVVGSDGPRYETPVYTVPEGDHINFVSRSYADLLSGAGPYFSLVSDADSVIPGSTNDRDS